MHNIMLQSQKFIYETLVDVYVEGDNFVEIRTEKL